MSNEPSDFARSISIATSGLRAQAGRMRLSQHVPGEGEPSGKVPSVILTDFSTCAFFSTRMSLSDTVVPGARPEM